MARNAVMLEETKDTITVPAAFMIRMLACIHSLRTRRNGAPNPADNTDAPADRRSSSSRRTSAERENDDRNRDVDDAT